MLTSEFTARIRAVMSAPKTSPAAVTVRSSDVPPGAPAAVKVTRANTNVFAVPVALNAANPSVPVPTFVSFGIQVQPLSTIIELS
jgi:hypothetical protein